jgi:transposase
LPGHQLQIDFGERVEIAGERVKAFLFVATLGYSRRCHVRAYRSDRQQSLPDLGIIRDAVARRWT